MRVDGWHESANRVELRTSSPAPGIVVASLLQDGGWRARDESGRDLPTWAADGPFLAFEAPAGDHRIALRYAPPGSREGLAASAAGLLGGAWWLAWRRRRLNALRQGT